MAGIWKITTIGDPFMIAPPPDRFDVPMVPLADAVPVPDAVPLIDVARENMKAIADDPDRAFDAIQGLVLLGRDKLAIELWERLQENADPAAISAAASAVLDPLFRSRQWSEFVEAYDRLPRESRNADTRDMLWHLAAPRLSSIQDPQTMSLLRQEIREPFPQADLELILPHLDRALGPGSAQSELARRIDAEPDERRRAALERLR